MRNLLVLAVLLFPAAPLCAEAGADWDDSLSSLLREELALAKKSNEQIVAGIAEDQFAAKVVVRIQAGENVPEDEITRAYTYCKDSLSKIETRRLRKKMVKGMMKDARGKIEAWAFRGGSADRFHTARMMETALFRRFSLLLEFQAERYRRFLKVLVDDC